MIKLKNKTALLIVLASAATSVFARENVGVVQKAQNASTILANNCTQSTHLEVLNVNNVRTTIRGGGDFWWDGQFAKYEIPAESGKHSVYAGSIWIGGLSNSGNLKVAAMTYRQTGIDFWPGPLDADQEIIDENTGNLVVNPNYGQTNIDVCTEYNDHFKVTFKEVSEFYSNCINGTLGDVQYPNVINWPGNGVNGELSYMLAPFVDIDKDGVYEPEDCEYPAYDLTNSGDCLAKDVLFGDETIFWVFNDRGNIHTESSSESIGVEVQSQAFAFATNDEINDMTFYNYKILNRSVEALNSTYFGTWVDSDLGYHLDDYVGCDVARGLGYTYNGDEFDENSNGYGSNPPAMGLDFFRGPVADANDGIDNDRDGCIDCTYFTDADGNQIEIDDDATPELIIMSKFMFYNNTQSAVDGNPDIASDFYNYLSARFRNGNPITYGGTGQDQGNPPCDFMFPGDTDPSFTTNWTEETAGNTPNDRRFLITAGPFTLKPGAVNTITTGLVWARANQGGAFASVEKMRIADDKAQSLFDNCFQVLNGPDAPDLAFDAYDKQFIVKLSNSDQSNNFEDNYEEVDPTLIGTPEFPITSNKYVFEGYQIFQLADESVTSSDLYNLDKARLIHQSDVMNFRRDSDSTISTTDGITNLINYEKNSDLDAFVPVNKTISSANAGVKHSFTILQDAFAEGDNALINSKTYYYMAIAYGYNEYMQYKPDIPFDNNIYTPNSSGQKYPYKAGRRNIKIYKVRPYSKSGDLAGKYGTIPEMTRIQGNGSNGMALEFTDSTEALLRNSFCASEVTYKQNAGPVNIYVVDPSNLVKAKYQFLITPQDTLSREVTDSSSWILIQNPNTADADTVRSYETVGVNNEQIIPKWGLAVDVNINSEAPLKSRKGNNGFISSSLNYENTSDQWLTFFQDDEAPNFGNWIMAGTQQTKINDDANDGKSFNHFYSIDAVADIDGDEVFVDPSSQYENIISGGWAPYILANSKFGYPRYRLESESLSLSNQLEDFENLPSVKIVFTPNKDLWTRVPVIETATPAVTGVPNSGILKYIKNSPSLNKNNEADGSGEGWSWFPGYALDKTSGMRLNMVFGENSDDTTNNGNDMIFNPTHVDIDDDVEVTFDVDGNRIYNNLKMGGRHYIYVKNTLYMGDDEKNNPEYDVYKENLDAVKVSQSSGAALAFRTVRKIWLNVVWVSIPLRVEGNDMNESEITIDINVSTPFQSWNNSAELQACAGTEMNNSLPVYNFSTSTIDITNIVEDKGLDNELDLVNVVPNPYYGGSEFETNQIDHKVRITNLPAFSLVSIYSVDGVLVKQVDVEDGRDYDWDLKNIKGLSIASGVYIIYIKTPTSERSIKWFGALRPIDLDTF